MTVSSKQRGGACRLYTSSFTSAASRHHHQQRARRPVCLERPQRALRASAWVQRHRLLWRRNLVESGTHKPRPPSRSPLDVLMAGALARALRTPYQWSLRLSTHVPRRGNHAQRRSRRMPHAADHAMCQCHRARYGHQVPRRYASQHHPAPLHARHASCHHPLSPPSLRRPPRRHRPRYRPLSPLSLPTRPPCRPRSSRLEATSLPPHHPRRIAHRTRQARAQLPPPPPPAPDTRHGPLKSASTAPQPNHQRRARTRITRRARSASATAAAAARSRATSSSSLFLRPILLPRRPFSRRRRLVVG